jgi:hypothetical protein
VNNSVIVLKKKHILSGHDRKRYPDLRLSEGEETSARNILIKFLSNVIALLGKDAERSSEFIPAMMVEDYINKLSHNQFTKEDIQALAKMISSNENLDEKSLEILDALVSIIDSERSNLFRKLRTARG